MSKSTDNLRSKLYNSISLIMAAIILTAVLVLPQSAISSYAAPEQDNSNNTSDNSNSSFYGDVDESPDIADFSGISSNNKTIKVGYYIIDGFQMFEEPDIYSGYGYDYLQKIRTYTGWDYEYIGDDEDINFAELYRMTVEGEIDLIGGITWTEERAQKLLFSNVPIDMEYTTIYVPNGDTKYSSGDYSRWNGIRLGIVKGTAYVDGMRDFSNANYFTYKGIYYDSDEDLVNALNAGEIDAFVSGSSHNFPNVSILSQFNPSYLFFATGLENQELMDDVNMALSQIETVDSGFKESIMTKYYQGNGVSNITFTSTESLYLKTLATNNRKFMLLANPDNCPLSYLDEQGKPTGILVDMTTAILDSIGLSYEFYEVSDRKEYIDAINWRKADIVIDFVSDFGRSEKTGYFECDSYYSTSLSLVHQKSDLEYNTVIKREGDGIFRDNLLKDISGLNDVLFLDSINDTLDYMVDNLGTCTYLPTEVADVLVYKEETNKLQADAVTYRNLYFCFAINCDCGSYIVGIFNKACNSFPAGESAEILSRYNAADFKNTSFRAFIYDNPIYGFVIVASGMVIFFLVVIIYGGKQNRLKVEKLNKQLSEALEGEKKAAEAKKKFFDNISHDMRTPLNGILGLTRSILKNGIEFQDNLDYLYKIEDSASYLELLINDSLTMSNSGEIEFELDLKEADPGHVFDSLRNVALAYAHERDIRFVLRKKEIVNLPTILDYSRLEQAVLNVISNAVKFSYKNSTVEIDLTSRMVSDNRVEYTLSVQDHGIGMSKEFQNTMFDAYTQEDRGELTDHAGIGIGLSVVKAIVEKMDGSISVKSQENIGTIVTLTFVFEINTNSIIEELLESEESEEETLEGKNILYCEDNELNMDIVCAILESENATVEKAWNGQEGFEIYNNSSPGTFDAILMDIRMPVMDGLTAAREIRNSDKEDAKKIPIIAVSANAFDDDKDASKNAGMNTHLSKPVDPKILINELKHYISKQKHS